MTGLAFTLLKPSCWRAAAQNLTVPSSGILSPARFRVGLPWGVFALNAVGIAFISCGVFSSLYAGCLGPELRLTAGNLSALVNLIGPLLLFGLVDPHFSFMSDRVVSGETSEAHFRTCVAGMAASRVVGTLLAQVILVPGAIVIAWTASRI